MTPQAASWNCLAMDFAWALMSLPPMFQTCSSLIIGPEHRRAAWVNRSYILKGNHRERCYG